MSLSLSERELEVIRAFRDGSNYKEVGEKLNISPSTVNQHNYSSFRKMGFRNIIEAINYVNKLEMYVPEYMEQ